MQRMACWNWCRVTGQRRVVWEGATLGDHLIGTWIRRPHVACGVGLAPRAEEKDVWILEPESRVKTTVETRESRVRGSRADKWQLVGIAPSPSGLAFDRPIFYEDELGVLDELPSPSLHTFEPKNESPPATTFPRPSTFWCSISCIGPLDTGGLITGTFNHPWKEATAP